jgi:hypothetical protein
MHRLTITGDDNVTREMAASLVNARRLNGDREAAR